MPYARAGGLVGPLLLCLAAAELAAQTGSIHTLRRKTGPAAPALAAETRAVTERIVTRRLGEDGLNRVLGRRLDTDTTWATKWNVAGLLREPAAVTGRFVPSTLDDAMQRTALYGSFPGGVAIEGVATGMAEVIVARYDARFNAFIINDRAAYFTPVPAATVAALCRSIASDAKMRIGVSGTESGLVFGGVPPASPLAWDLRLADHFMSEFVFGTKDWTFGYRFAQGYEPQRDSTEKFWPAASFTFGDFVFRLSGTEVRVASEAVDVRVTPILRTAAPDGGFLPDVEAIARGDSSGADAANARHFAGNVAYYRRERIVDRMFAYGELSAFLRQLQRSGFDLAELATHVPGDHSVIASRQ